MALRLILPIENNRTAFIVGVNGNFSSIGQSLNKEHHGIFYKAES